MTFHPRFYQTDAVDSVFPPEGRKLVVVPTGGGKSFILSKIADDATPWVGRVLILVTSKELVVQNAVALLRHNPFADVGVICAGIDRNDCPAEVKDCLGRTDAEITVASVQSVYRKLDYWDDVGLIIVDEAHRITPVGGKLYRAVMDRFPKIPCVGLTATPFRVGTGYLHEGEHRLFDEISYEITMEELVDLGYLVPFAQKGSDLAYSTEGLRKTAGEFNQKDLDKLTDDGAKTRRIVSQFVQRSQGRNHVLIFAISVRHAKMIKQFLAEDHGEEAGIVYDQMAQDGLKREDEIDLFKMGIHRYVINVGILTTGFDFPALDCVVLARPIGSPVLFIQCIGRGTRTSQSTGKIDCLVLDYGGNVSRFGDFSKPEIRVKGEAKKVKECGDCGEAHTQGARYCCVCGWKFKEMFKACPKCEVELDATAMECGICGYGYPINEDKLDEDGDIVIGNKAVWIDVASWKAKVHVPYCPPGSDQRPNCILIDYKGVDGTRFKEYMFPESNGARPKFAMQWVVHSKNGNLDVVDNNENAVLRRNTTYNPPRTSKEAVDRWNELRLPRRVKVIRQNQYYNVLGREF